MTARPALSDAHSGSQPSCWERWRPEGITFANVTKAGKQATCTKAQLVKWKHPSGKEVTGHSTRRTGALRYIKHGWAIPQAADLGRWKSSVIYEYAAEALESLPVNTNSAFISDLYGTKEEGQRSMDPGELDRQVEEVRNYLMSEMALAKEHHDRAVKALDFEVEAMKKRADTHGGKLPPFLQSLGSKIIHDNWDMASCSPPMAWRTKCDGTSANPTTSSIARERRRRTLQKVPRSGAGQMSEVVARSMNL